MSQVGGLQLTAKAVIERMVAGYYREFPEQYPQDAYGYSLDDWQKETIRKLFLSENGRVSVRASHGAGKTFVSGILCNMFLELYSPARVAVTGPCVEENEKILLADGRWERVKDLNGRYFGVLSLMEDFSFSPHLATAFPNGIKPVFKIKTRSGREAIRTANHPFMKMNGWAMLSDLKVGDFIAIPKNLPAHGKQTMPEEDVKIIAYLISEGCTTKAGYGHVLFAQNPGVVLDEFRKCVEKKGCHIAQQGPRSYAIVGDVKTEGGRGINPVKDLCKEYDLYGKHSWEKRVPRQIFELNDDLIRIFLSRLFAGDGYIRFVGDTKELGYNSTSRELIDDVNRLILRFGIAGRIRCRKRPLDGEKRGYGTRRDMYHWYLSGPPVDDFLREIGFFGRGEGPQRLMDIKHDRHRPILFDIFPAEFAQVVANSKKMQPRKMRGAIGKKIGIWRTRNINRSALFLAAGLLGLTRLENIAKSDCSWDEIVKIEPLGERMTYGIEVPGPENYLTDFVEHNTGKQTRQQVWSYISQTHDRSVFKELFVWQRTKLAMKGREEEAFAVWLTSKNPRTIEGFHGPDEGRNLLWMVEEAKAVDDAVFESIQGALTHENNLEYISSTCGGAHGFFYDTHHSKSDRWETVHVPYYKSSRISEKKIQEWREMWGENSSIFRARALAEFPDEDDKIICPLAWCERAVLREIDDDIEEAA